MKLGIAPSIAAFGILFAIPVMAQDRTVAVYTKTEVRDIVQRMERPSDDFRKHFEKALDKSIRDIGPRLNTLLAIAAGINRVMLYRTFDTSAERDWDCFGAISRPWPSLTASLLCRAIASALT